MLCSRQVCHYQLNRGPAKTSGDTDASLYMMPVAWGKETCPPLNWLGREVLEGLFQITEMFLDLLT